VVCLDLTARVRKASQLPRRQPALKILQESSGAENELTSAAADQAHVASDITVDEEAMLQAKLKQLRLNCRIPCHFKANPQN